MIIFLTYRVGLSWCGLHTWLRNE